MNGEKFSVEKFKELLDESYTWPDFYEFKFIVKIAAKNDVVVKLPGFAISETLSKNGNYVAISARKLMNNTQEVLDIYDVMSKVDGIISL